MAARSHPPSNWPRAVSPLARLNAVELTPVETRIAGVISQRYPEAALLSARRIAGAANASPASVTRFAIKLGYADFAELQAELAVEMRSRLSSPPSRLTVNSPGRRRTAAALLREVISRDKENLDSTVSMIDEDQLELLARRLAHSRGSSVYVTGSKKGGVVAAYFAMQLAQLRPGVILLDLSDLTADAVLDLGAEDLVVAFEPRRATVALVRLLEIARSAGAEVAAFTDEHPPATLAESGFLFRTRVDAVSVFDSYAGMFALCDALLAALVEHIPKAVRDRAERLERLNAEFSTWYRPRASPGGDGDRPA
jgi:DNA-binding MurR/RpiR family transcriptional regulator